MVEWAHRVAYSAAFTNFILQVQLPPNPIRRLDRSLTAQQQAGLTFYNGPISDRLKNCNGCHTLNAAQGFFGSDGRSTFEGETQHFKVAHLRNAYQKVGMFGTAGLAGGNPLAPQVRGFGYLHDGSIATVMNFLGSGSSDPTPTRLGPGARSSTRSRRPVAGSRPRTRASSSIATSSRPT